MSDLDRGLTDAGADDSPDDGTNNPGVAPRLIRRRILRSVRRLPAPRPARVPLQPAAPAAPRTAAGPPPVAFTAPVRDARAGPPYETFYGLTEKPFSLSTDPVFLYVRRTVVLWERVPPTPSAPRIPQSVPLRVPTVPVSALPRTRPAGDNRPASSAI